MTRAGTSTWGRGEFIGSAGDVMPFDLIPTQDVELNSNGPAGAFMLASGVQLKGEGVFGREAPAFEAPLLGPNNTTIPFRPYAITTRLRTTRRVPRECWVRPVSVPLFLDLFESTPHVFFQTISDGRQTSSREIPDSMNGSMQLVEIRETNFEKEVLPVLNEAELSCEKCSADQWTRIDLLGLPADPFGDGEHRLPPLEIIVWLDRDAREIAEIFKPSLECGFAQENQEVVGERRFSDPRVIINPYKIDSIDLPSSLLSVADVRGMSVRHTHWTPAGGVVEISLTGQCAVDSLDPCWSEKVQLPSKGEVAVTQGVSGTTVPRAAIRSATPAAFGSRTVAVHGLFDRSGIAVFTDVPRIYRDIGLTTRYSDYRGTSYFDWNHTPAPSPFAAPGGARHVPLVKTAWNPQSRPFFANWKTDVVRLSHRATYPMSYCSLTADMFAVPTEMKFEGGGLAAPRLVTPSQVFTSPAGPSGDYRISPAASAAASVSALVSP